MVAPFAVSCSLTGATLPRYTKGIMITPIETTPRPSVSTWALHPLIGTTYPGRPGDANAYAMGSNPGTLDLLDVPAQLASRGIKTMEVCHFHLSPDPIYCDEFGAAVRESGVELWNLLIDDGDLTHPEHGARDAAWIQSWLDIGGMLGARCSRIIAGKQPANDANLAIARERLLALAIEAYLRGVRVVTENWFDLLPGPEYVNRLLTDLNGVVGLCFDFGNWDARPDKYDALAQIAHLAESSHAKCRFDATGVMDDVDFRRCLDTLARASYQGPFTMVASDPTDIWGGIERQAEFLRTEGYTLS